MNPQDLFKNLEASWHVDRTIKPGGVMIGQVEFKPASETEYHYTEQGTLTTDASDVIEDVTRAYTYKFENDTIQIYYADGPDKDRLFQTLEFIEKNKAIAEHLCGDDLYQSEYEFDLPHGFKITHRVTGPKKDYVSVTNFSINS